MWVPSYSAKDFVLCLSDALDWRRMAIGVALFLWVATAANFIIDLVTAQPEFVPQLLAAFDGGLVTLLSDGLHLTLRAFGYLALVGAALLVAMFMIYPLMRGGATEVCRGERSSLPAMWAFTKHHVIAMIVLEALGFIAIALVALPLVWALRNFGGLGAWLLLIIFGPLTLLGSLFLGAQITLFAAHALAGGPASEALFRSAYYLVKAPIVFANVSGQKAAVTAAVAVPAALILVYAPWWIGYPVALPWIGFAVSYGAASDVLIYVKLRHAVDGAPYTLCIDPEEEFLHRASRMEQEMAIEKTGLLAKTNPTS